MDEMAKSPGGYACSSGRHTWSRPEDAGKCCNGWRRVLHVETPGSPLPADVDRIIIVAGARCAWGWMPIAHGEGDR